jgi:hypothetical protein
MIKEFFLKRMMQSQLKNMPKDQQEKVMHLIEKNPDLFMKIAKETQDKVKGGKDQMAAMMEVSKKYQGELKKALEDL